MSRIFSGFFHWKFVRWKSQATTAPRILQTSHEDGGKQYVCLSGLQTICSENYEVGVVELYRVRAIFNNKRFIFFILLSDYTKNWRPNKRKIKYNSFFPGDSRKRPRYFNCKLSPSEIFYQREYSTKYFVFLSRWTFYSKRNSLSLIKVLIFIIESNLRLHVSLPSVIWSLSQISNRQKSQISFLRSYWAVFRDFPVPAVSPRTDSNGLVLRPAGGSRQQSSPLLVTHLCSLLEFLDLQHRKSISDLDLDRKNLISPKSSYDKFILFLFAVEIYYHLSCKWNLTFKKTQLSLTQSSLVLSVSNKICSLLMWRRRRRNLTGGLTGRTCF